QQVRSSGAAAIGAVHAVALVLGAVEKKSQPAPFAFNQNQAIFVGDADYAHMRQAAVRSSIDRQVAGLRRLDLMVSVVLEDGFYVLAFAYPKPSAGEHPTEAIRTRIGPGNPKKPLR